MPTPQVRYSFLAHEPAVRPHPRAALASGGAGYAVAEQAAALRRHLARHAVPGSSADVALLCPVAPEPALAVRDVPSVTFAPPAGSLDDIARQFIEDPAWQRRLGALLGHGAVLAHHLPAARLALALGLPTLCALHSLWPGVQAALGDPTGGPRGTACAALLAGADAVLVATAAERTWLLRTAPPEALARDLDARVHVVPQGVSPFLVRLAARADGGRRRTAWRARLLPGVHQDDIVLYAVGRFVPYKRPLEVLEAFVRVAPRLPRARLLLVGPPTDAAYAARCARVVEAAPPDVRRRIALRGPQRLEAAPLAGDVLVHLSRFETWGRTIDEAFALGRPAVLAASPFLAERVDRPWPPEAAAGQAPQDRALWIDANDPGALDAALVRAVTDAAWRRACGTFHRAQATSHDPEGAAHTLLTIWNDVEFARLGTRPFVLRYAPGRP